MVKKIADNIQTYVTKTIEKSIEAFTKFADKKISDLKKAESDAANLAVANAVKAITNY